VKPYLYPTLKLFEPKIEVFFILIDFYTRIYCSAYFYTNVSKHKSFYFQLTINHNQFFKLNLLIVIFCYRGYKVRILPVFEQK